VQALARLAAREAVPVLVANLGRDPDPDVRMEIAAALGTLEAKEAVGPLMRVLQDDPDGDVRLEACKALGSMRDPRAVDALMTCLQADTVFGLNDWDLEDDIGFDVAWALQREALEAISRKRFPEPGKR
jgi:HEAT repeat protein